VKRKKDRGKEKGGKAHNRVIKVFKNVICRPKKELKDRGEKERARLFRGEMKRCGERLERGLRV